MVLSFLARVSTGPMGIPTDQPAPSRVPFRDRKDFRRSTWTPNAADSSTGSRYFRRRPRIERSWQLHYGLPIANRMAINKSFASNWTRTPARRSPFARDRWKRVCRFVLQVNPGLAAEYLALTESLGGYHAGVPGLHPQSLVKTGILPTYH